MKSKQNQIKIVFRPSRALPPPPCIGELSHVGVMMADAWKTLNKKVTTKRTKKDPPEDNQRARYHSSLLLAVSKQP